MAGRSSDQAASTTQQLGSLSLDSPEGKRNPLPAHILKKLAEDIESNGGITAFKGRDNQKLAIILDSRVDRDIDPYGGERGNPIRKKLGQKLYKWSVLALEKPQKYKNLLKDLGVTPHSQRIKTSAIISDEISSDSDGSSVDSKSSTSDSDPRIYPKTPKFPKRIRPKQVAKQAAKQAGCVSSSTKVESKSVSSSFAPRVELQTKERKTMAIPPNASK